MNPFWVIGVIIMALGLLHRYAMTRYARDREDTSWFVIALATMLLEVEARKARDRARQKPAEPTSER